MIVYFKIRYLEKGEYDIKEQISFIRNFIENTCQCNDLGLRFVGHVTHGFYSDFPVVLVKYRTTDDADIKAINKTIEEYSVPEEFLIFTSL